MPSEIITEEFLAAVELLVRRHHTIYRRLPPQGVFLEALIEEAFLESGTDRSQVLASTQNSPQHDLLVCGIRVSVKSETGKATKPDRISITKLCTTETGEWNPRALVARALAHLSRYDRILMLRAVWQEDAFNYQFVEIPTGLVRQMQTADFREVGFRRGRRSVAAHVMDGETRIFRVHFDGVDGKCQVQDLLVDRCAVLGTWRQPIFG